MPFCRSSFWHGIFRQRRGIRSGQIYEWQAAVENYWQANKAALLSQTLSITASVASVVANLVMGFVFAVYILLEKKQLAVSSRRALYAFCSAERARYIIAAASLAKRICSGFIGGQLLEAFLLGLMCFAGMIILGIPYAFVISALVACLAVVPYIGSITSAVIGCIFIVISQPEKVIVFIIFFLVLQRIEAIFSIRELSANPSACRSCGCLLRL